MTAKGYLQQARRLNEIINRDIAEVERLRLLSSSVSSPNLSEKRAVANNRDAPFINCIARLYDLENKINSEVDGYVDLLSEIRDRINGIENPDERLLLQSRYLSFMTWEEIARLMKFTPQWVYTLHGRALNAFSKKYGF